LAVSGRDAERICAFERCHGGEVMVVAVSRFPARDLAGPGFAGTALSLPDTVEAWTSLFDGAEIKGTNGTIAAADLFRELPVAVLTGVTPPA
jgi:maltooligosyltrehalose synthase